MNDIGKSCHRVAAGHELQLLTDSAVVPKRLKGSVMLLGNFDGFHCGHQALLAAARAEASACGAPLGVMSVEPHPKQLFAPHSEPFRLSSPTTKRETFSRLGLDFLYSPRFNRAFAGQEPEQFIDDILVGGLAVSRIVVGRGFRFGKQRRGDVDLLCRFGEQSGFAVTAVDELGQDGAKYSSTLVRNHLAAGEIDAANALLGGPWSVELGALPGSLRLPGEGSVSWPVSVLKPACGEYRVMARQAETEMSSLGTLAISPTTTSLTLQSSGNLASAPLIVDFLGRA
ncbi:FAD synthetase family protein [Borborobacter arsenicus]|nr:FAD synthetase family protein [Pseudaminobacter arsenicus]